MNWKQTGVMPGDEQVMVNKLEILSLSLSLSLCVTGEAIETGCQGLQLIFGSTALSFISVQIQFLCLTNTILMA